MHRRSLHRILHALFVLSVAAAALAAPRDKAAQGKIDEAINVHYFATEFDKAEAILLGVIKACEDKCSEPILGKAWMYIGIVRGSGRSDMQGAKEAFLNAVALDPKVQLDAAIANQPTKDAWQEISGTAPTGPAPAPTGGGGGGDDDDDEGLDVPGAMTCSLEVTEVDTRRPIPIECYTDEDAESAELRYKAFATEKWEKLRMRKRGDGFRATIPCTATMMAGDLKFYVRARDSEGIIDQFGRKSEPATISIVPESDEEAPAFPDADPPERCAEEQECPPDFPGCEPGGAGAAGGGEAARPKHGNKGWGSTCDGDIECQPGLQCMAGSCEDGQKCSTDDECVDAFCIEDTCTRDVDVESGGGGPSGPYKKFWVGVHVAQDIAFISGDDVCSFSSQANDGWACYYKGSEPATRSDNGATVDVGGLQYLNPPVPGAAGGVNGGTSIASTRFLLSFDFAALDTLTVGLRAGYALNGAPDGFLPVHAEVRGAWWPLGTPRSGFRPYLHLGGGMAQVDASIDVTVRDCGKRGGVYFINPFNGGDPNFAANPGEELFFPNDATDPNVAPSVLCAQAQFADAPSLDGTGLSPQDFDGVSLTAYRTMGRGFATLGGGLYYGFIEQFGAQLNLNVVILFPDSGFALQPSLGFMYGF